MQRPVAGGGPSVASLEEARKVLRAMLGLRPGSDPREVPLPNVKRLFRSEHQLVLSETALGHTRLCDLLQDERFSDLCSLRQQGNGYMVVPRQQQSTDATNLVEVAVLSELTGPSVTRRS